MMEFGLFMPSFRNHHFSFGDCYIRVEEGGPGQGFENSSFLSSACETALFFLHGRFEHTEMWRPVTHALTSRFRCFTIDLPGFGHSFSVRDRGLSLLEQAYLVQQLISRFRRRGEQVILIGHDTGGGIAQLCAVQIGQASGGGLSGLVLISSSVLCEPVRGLNPGWFGLGARWRLIRLLNQCGFIHPDWEEAMVAPWFVHSSRLALIRAWRALEESWPGNFERQFWRRELERLAVPVLLLWGGKDALNEPETGRALVQSFRDANFFVNSDIGHWPSLEDPQWVVSKLQEFAFSVAPRTNTSTTAAVGF